MANESTYKAHASPTKEFFVNMITRDITLEDSILDLIDNSIDAAWQSAGSHAMSLSDQTELSGYKILIEMSAERFSITDNCGGMSQDNAENHAFSFGKKKESKYSIGVYGIGMKRAVFKIGKQIQVKSTYSKRDGSTSSFTVPINVTNWLDNKDSSWDFNIVTDQDLYEKGVEIVVEDLTSAVRISFENPAFIEKLRRMIARDYSLYLARGLKIAVGGQDVVGIEIKLNRSDEFIPMRVRYEDKQDVSVEILGGMAASPPDDIAPDEISDGDKRYGWYVACNGRIVLAADKSPISGWGQEDWPQWHRQYSGFMGIVLFTASNTVALPLTTTKRNVDLTSEVFLRARLKMRDLSKEWIAYTNYRKQVLNEAKHKEAEAVGVAIQNIEINPTITLPALKVERYEHPANVHYSVPKKKMKKLAKELGSINFSYRDVGLKSFDYTYNDFVGEE